MEVKVEESKEIVKLVCNALEEKKAEDVKVIDIRNLSVVADYFIVANGSNQNQLLAMQDEVDKVLYTHGIHAKQIEGNRSSTWILMDYEDVIVHLLLNAIGKVVCRFCCQPFQNDITNYADYQSDKMFTNHSKIDIALTDNMVDCASSDKRNADFEH